MTYLNLHQNILKTEDLMLNVNRGTEAGSGVSDSK